VFPIILMAPLLEYRPNPNRSIYVQGEIGIDLVHRLTPQILSLQNQSRDPITVYIDSSGGSPADVTRLLQLLKAPNQETQIPCKVITVVVTNAFSAAADLLAFGNYAVAFPTSTILFHGGRVPTARELTAERSSLLAQALRFTNETSAMELAREVQFRFMFRFITSRAQFGALRVAMKEPNRSDLDCLVKHISSQVSEAARNILKKARARYGRYEELVKSINRAQARIKVQKTPTELEGIELKAIVDFEVKQNKNNPDWNFGSEGINSLTDDFLLFRGYEGVLRSDRYRRMCAQYGSFLVDNAEAQQIDLIPNENDKLDRWTERVSPALRPIWSFFVALCHTLQQGEDEFLNAEDAYWLGLIDEVMGKDNLMHMRHIMENATAAATAP